MAAQADMAAPVFATATEGATDVCTGVDAAIVALRSAGAGRFDPVRLRYIESLAARAAARQGKLRAVLDSRLVKAVAAFEARFSAARSEAEEQTAAAVLRFPQSAAMLQRMLASGDFITLAASIEKLAGRDQVASLGDLTRRLEQVGQVGQTGQAGQASLADDAGALALASTGARPELRTVRHFRNDLARLSIDRQVAQALEQAPKNAGPINSHMLVLRSLALMRDIAPDYLDRFMSYVDTLLILDQDDHARIESEKPAPPKKKGSRSGKK
jgi:hypothetical protein